MKGESEAFSLTEHCLPCVALAKQGKQKAAGECHASQPITHRPSPTAANGLHAMGKTHIMILQTKKQYTIGGKNHVLEEENNSESQYGVDVGSLLPNDWHEECQCGLRLRRTR